MKTLTRILLLLLIAAMTFAIVSCDEKEADDDKNNDDIIVTPPSVEKVSDKWPSSGIAGQIDAPPAFKKVVTYSENSKDLYVGLSENATKSQYDSYVQGLKNDGFTTIDESDADNTAIGLNVFSGKKGNTYINVTYLEGTMEALMKSTMIDLVKEWGGSDLEISDSTNMFTYVSNFDMDEEDLNDDPSTPQGLFEGYTLPENFVIKGTMIDIPYVLARVNGDIFYSLCYTEALTTADYYKKTATGYTHYVYGFTDSMKLEWDAGEAMTEAELADEMQLTSESYFADSSITSTFTNNGTENITINDKNIATKKYSMSIGDTSSVYNVHPTYSFVVKSVSTALGITVEVILTYIDVNPTDFSAVGLTLPV